MQYAEISKILDEAGIRPTSNRLIVLKALADSHGPMSVGELEDTIDTLDKSSVFRVLTLLLEHHLVHAVEDGRGIVKYELCRAADSEHDSDMHVHFYCDSCRRVYCFEDIPVPEIPLPEGFESRSVNYMVKGICPDCANR